MSETRVKDLLDVLAATAPEPSEDMVAAVRRSAGLRRRIARRPRSRLVPVAVALATVMVVLLAVGVVALTGRAEHPATPLAPPSPASGDAVAASGSRFAQLFFSPDYRTIDRYSNDVAGASTGPWRSDFVAKRSQLKDLLTQVRSVARGRVLAAGAREVTPTSATVLLVVDQTVQNSTTRGSGITNRYRVGLDLRRIDGGWLVSNLEPVAGAPFGAGCPDPVATPDRSALLEQTCAAVDRLNSYDYRTLDADLTAARALTVPGSFRTAVETQTMPALRDLAPRTHSVVRARASTAAILDTDGSRARVLVFENQAVSSGLLKQPRQDRNRIVATMQRVGDRWLVVGLTAL